MFVDMTLRFLGCGGAFADSITRENLPMVTLYNENVVPRRLFIDFGCDAKHSLERAGLSYSDVDAVYISHLHSDHIGGLEKLGFSSYFSRLPKPKMFIADYLVEQLWTSLKGGMAVLDDREMLLEDYFEIIRLQHDVETEVQLFDTSDTKVKLTCISVPHIRPLNPEMIGTSNALMLDINGTKLFFTTDTRHAPQYLDKRYRDADVIIQDCQDKQTSSLVHAPLSALKTLDAEIKSKMILTHHSGRWDAGPHEFLEVANDRTHQAYKLKGA